MSAFYGQFDQDKHLMETIYNHKRGGFFVDVGAYDGRDMSNTLALEQSYGWNGICAEPNKRLYNKLVSIRKCICTDLAVWKKDDEVVEFWDDNIGGCSTIGTKSQLNSHPVLSSVKTISLLTLLDKYEAPSFIEYVSMDTEGTEFDILSAFHESDGFMKYKFGYMTIEHNFETEKRAAINQLLTSVGYRLYRSHNVDDEYTSLNFKK